MRTTYSIAIAATLMLAGCGDSSEPKDNQGGPPPGGAPVAGLALSAPVPSAAAGSSPSETVVFVSVAPRTIARAATVEIKSDGVAERTLAATDGGFDPVAVPGEAGDQVEVTITDSAGGKTTKSGFAKERMRPRVVRTSPASRKTDVPLNIRVSVVFTTPMDSASVVGGVTVLVGGVAVSGTLELKPGALAVEFTPTAPLVANSNYEVRVAGSVRDVLGTTLGDGLVVGFRTAGTPAVPTGSIRVITMTTGENIDPDGYSVWVPPSPPSPRSIGISDTLLVPDVPAGDQSISLDELSVNCLVDDGKVHGVQVAAGATTTVLFTVRCTRGNRLTIVTSTSGSDLDPDGYSFYLTNLNVQGIDGNVTGAVPVATNGSYVLADVLPGTYALVLLGVSPNCSHGRVNFPGYHEPVTMAGADVTATFVVNCLPVRQLAAVAGDGPAAEIYLINSNGVGQTRLTSNAALDDDPAWSPDGSRIVFSSDRDGNREIYVMNANGSGQVRLTNSAGADYQPAWSPDGNWIAFVSDRDGNAEVYRMNTDGSSLLRLTSAGGDDLDPTWSPDGGRVAFSSSRSGPAHIYVMNADGGGQVQITFDKPTLVGALQPAWSPDGASIAFVGQQLGENAEAQRIIHRVAPDGSAEGYLGSSPETLDGVSDPAWSADGRQLSASSGACYGCGTGIQMHRTSDGAYTGAMIYDASGATVLARNAAWRP